MSAHAILSPSAAHRWLNCTPSARLEEPFPDKSGDAAKEGTLAHSLGELMLRLKLRIIDQGKYDVLFSEIEQHPMFDHAMIDHCENYAVFVMERYVEAQMHTKDALIFLEQKLNLTDYVEEGFGTGDTVIIADSVMDIIDLKYGKGVLVSAQNNKQMMMYSLGALREFDFMYDIHTVRMTIYQPRIDNYSTWEMSVSELRQWAEQDLKPRAALAYAGEGEFNPGEHCRFCRAKAVCKANAEMHLQLARYDFQNPALLSEMEVADILNRTDGFINWINAVSEHALTEAVENGKKWPGYKLVEGRSNRKYADEATVATKLLKAGFAEEIIYTKKLLGITAMEKAIGKKEFGLHLTDLLVKPPGSPTLVPESDKRPELNSTESARKDFINA